MFRILSIDGGGLRGFIPLQIIKDLESRTGKSIHESFDLIAGTSTGGLIACGLTYASNGIDRSYETDQLIETYRQKGATIFPPFVSQKSLMSPLADLKRTKHSSGGLDFVINEMFGSDHLDKCVTPVLIPAYDIRSSDPLIFTSRVAQQSDSLKRRNPRIQDVLRATTAAPTYLPSHSFKSLDGSGASKNIVTAIDGGIFANNPSLLAIQEALGAERSFYPTPARSMKDIAVLSIGTGHHMFDYAKENTASWGVFQWGSRIFDLMTYASSQSVDSIISNTLVKKKHYLRVNIDIDRPEYSEMDIPAQGCYDYWQKEVNVQLLTNDGYIKDIEDFIASSGL